MMICEFPDNPTPGTLTQLTCQRCGHSVQTSARRYVRQCHAKEKRSERGPCSLLGAEIGRVACTSCGGSVAIKVFACELHDRATLGKTIDGATNCAGCKDWQAKDAQPQATT